MNNKIFACMPLAWTVWQNNELYREFYGTFNKYWNLCRRDLYFGLRDGEVFDPRYSDDKKDIRWFKPYIPKKRRKHTPSFDEAIQSKIDCKAWNKHYKTQQKIKEDRLASGDLPLQELLWEFHARTGKPFIPADQLMGKHEGIGVGYKLADVKLDWITEEVDINARL